MFVALLAAAAVGFKLHPGCNESLCAGPQATISLAADDTIFGEFYGENKYTTLGSMGNEFFDLWRAVEPSTNEWGFDIAQGVLDLIKKDNISLAQVGITAEQLQNLFNRTDTAREDPSGFAKMLADVGFVGYGGGVAAGLTKYDTLEQCKAAMVAMNGSTHFFYAHCSLDEGKFTLGVSLCVCTHEQVRTFTRAQLEPYFQQGFRWYMTSYPGKPNPSQRQRRDNDDSNLQCKAGENECTLQFAQQLEATSSKNSGLDDAELGLVIGGSIVAVGVFLFAIRHHMSQRETSLGHTLL